MVLLQQKMKKKYGPQYEELSPLLEQYYLAKRNGKYGVINLANEVILPFEYSEISYKKEADFVVANKVGQTEQEWYNNKLEKQLNGIISEMDTQKAYFRAYVNGEYKYYNFKFEEKPSQECLTANSLFLRKKDGKYGYVNKQNEVVVDYIYEDAKEFNQHGFAAIKQNGKWGAIDASGKIIVEPTYLLDDKFIIDFIGTWHLANDINSYYYTK